jgi:hypothetical protein
MAIEMNERIAALATVVTDGDLEVLKREPFAARLGGPGAPTVLETFVFEPVGVTVVDLYISVARVMGAAEVDYWIARVSPHLFNVHVAARDIDDVTFVEARSTLVADGLTIETLSATLALLNIGAGAVAEQLQQMMQERSVGVATTNTSPSSPPSVVTPMPQRPTHTATGPVAFAGYL